MRVVEGGAEKLLEVESVDVGKDERFPPYASSLED